MNRQFVKHVQVEVQRKVRLASLKLNCILQNLLRVSSNGGSILARKPSIGAAAKAMLASKQLVQEPSAKFPLPAAKAPAGGKLSGREHGPDTDAASPGARPALDIKTSDAKKAAGVVPAGRSRVGVPRPSK